mgnify:CR=1 FL=1
MKSSRSWRAIAPNLLYEAFPASDLLTIEPPPPGMTIEQFSIEAEESGDTLFLFLCREADDDIELDEYLARLDRAIDDIESVRHAVATLQSHGKTRTITPPRPSK